MSRGPIPTRPGLRAPIRWEPAARPGGGTRYVARLEAADALRFARAVARVVPFVERARGPGAIANRVEGLDPTGIVLEPWLRARTRWRREVRRLALGARAVAVTDVRSCYPSIRPDVVSARLIELGAPRADVAEVLGWLRAFETSGASGLPVGPPASAVLADAVLMAGDHILREAAVPHARWVDDFVMFLADRRAAGAALESLRRGLAPLRLDLHEGKTSILSVEEVAVRLRSTSISPACRDDR